MRRKFRLTFYYSDMPLTNNVMIVRHKLLTNLIKLWKDNQLVERIDRLPIELSPRTSRVLGRCCVHKERAVWKYKSFPLMGFDMSDETDELTPLSEYARKALERKGQQQKDNILCVIDEACSSCVQTNYEITNLCKGCVARACATNCPKNAISFVNGKAFIDQDLCIKCGRCVTTCPYNAIVKVERPCAKACGVGAIRSDEHGRADIDYNKCVSCGMCLVNCPFGAIVDKGQIFQLIQSIKRGDEVIAIVAPAFVNQFPNMTPAKLREAMKRLGFANTAEVAIGADLCTIDEAHDFLEEVPSKHPFMGTSCCPAWSVMAKKNFPKFADCISMAMTPMVLTARLLKQDHPAARICFVGPCAAKKLEASRHSVRSEVDFVLTFEELMGMFEAKQINFDDLPDDPNDNFNNASADGRGFAVSGGVAQAVVNVIKKEDPTREVKVVSAQGLAECKKMMQLAAAGKYNGYLLEGMACPGGCIAGAGTLADPARSAMMLNKYKAQATMKTAADTPYKDTLDKLKY